MKLHARVSGVTRLAQYTQCLLCDADFPAGRKLFRSSKCSGRRWGPPTPYPKVTRGLFAVGGTVKLTTDLGLWLRTHGAIPPTPYSMMLN
jgi:hypothetical protein